jgi:phosphoglycerate kinase
MKTLSDFNFKNRIALLRTDLNSDVKNKKIIPSERIKQSAQTISELKRKKAKIVVIAHQGRPGKDDFLSLKQHAKMLNKYTKIKFIPDTIGEKAIKAIQNLKSENAILLENLRFLKEEFHPGKNKLVKFFLNFNDIIYVNDAFSVCHRKQTSIVSFPKYMPNCAGRLLEKEVAALKKIQLQKCLYVLGGAKPEDNLILLRRNKVLACGLFGQVCTIARGKNLGAQNKYLKKEIKNYPSVLKKLKKRLKNVQTPLDFAVKVKGKRKEILLEQFPSKYEIFDIGKKTQELFKKEIRKAKTIYMKGPAGFSSENQFAKGTFGILKAIAQNKGFSIIGGGHLRDAIEKSKISKTKFNHISLSGGALLNYIAGKKLPGLEALK